MLPRRAARVAGKPGNPWRIHGHPKLRLSQQKDAERPRFYRFSLTANTAPW